MEPSAMTELFKQAIRGDENARMRYNEHIRAQQQQDAMPENMLVDTEEAVAEETERKPHPVEELIDIELATEEDRQSILDEANRIGSEEFAATFGSISPRMTDADLQAVFEKTLVDQLENKKQEDLSAEQIQFLETVGDIKLSGAALDFYQQWHRIRPQLRDRLQAAAKARGITVGKRGDYYFPLRKADQYMTESETQSEWLLSKEDFLFGNMKSRKEGVSPYVYDQNPVNTVQEYLSGLARLEIGSRIIGEANSVDLQELVTGLKTLEKYDGIEDLVESEIDVGNAKVAVERAKEVLKKADAAGVTIDLQELDSTTVDTINDLYLRDTQKDHRSEFEGIGTVTQVFDNVPNGFGGATRFVKEIMKSPNAKGRGVRDAVGRVAELYHKRDIVPFSEKDNKILFDLANEYGLENIADVDTTDVPANELKYIELLQDYVSLVEELAEEHELDPNAAYELRRNDTQYWSEALKTSTQKDHFFSHAYVNLNKMMNHAYISPVVRKIKLYRRALDKVSRPDGSTGFPQFSGYLQKYVSEALVGDINQIDSALNIMVGSKAQRVMRQWQAVRTRSHLVGNLGFILGTQSTSIGFTFTGTGIANTMKGLFLASQPDSNLIVEYGPFEESKRTDLLGPLFQATEVGDIVGAKQSFVQEFDKIASKPSTAIEKYLSRASVIAFYYKAKQMGMNDADAQIYADINGTETQTHYKRETRAFVQNSDVLKMISAHQSFAVTAMNQAKAIIGMGIPLSAKERMLRALWLMISASVISMVMKQLTGRSYYTAGSFVPYGGDIVDAQVNSFLADAFKADTSFGEFLREYGPVTRFSKFQKTDPDFLTDVSSLYRAFEELASDKNPKRLYKWSASYGLAALGIGGGTQYNRVIDVLYALQNKGQVQDVSGKEMFSLEDTDYIKALIYGVYSTDEGKDYISGTKKSRKNSSASYQEILNNLD